ncbi:MAG: hypothetical protein IPK83_07370 [Planctomycetes bacterium]|nr:hypothetical protein [Planctomycetota bacterium]
MGNARLALAEYPKDGKMQPPNCFAFDVSRSLDAKPLPLTPGLGGYCSATTVSPNGQYAAYALNSVYVWNLESSSLVGDQFTPNNLDTLEKWKSIGAHGGYRPLSCAFSLDSRFLVVAAGANAFAVFEVATGKTLRFVQRNSSGHKISGIRHASFSITSDLVLVREGATFSIYHVPTGKWIFDSWKVSKLNDRMTHDSVAPQVEVLSSRVFVLSQEGEISCFELFIDSE